METKFYAIKTCFVAGKKVPVCAPPHVKITRKPGDSAWGATRVCADAFVHLNTKGRCNCKTNPSHIPWYGKTTNGANTAPLRTIPDLRCENDLGYENQRQHRLNIRQLYCTVFRSTSTCVTWLSSTLAPAQDDALERGGGMHPRTYSHVHALCSTYSVQPKENCSRVICGRRRLLLFPGARRHGEQSGARGGDLRSAVHGGVAL